MIICSLKQKQEILRFTKQVRDFITEHTNFKKGIFDGASGISLFCFYYHQFDLGDSIIYNKGMELLESESSAFTSSPNDNFAFSNLKWLIWTVSFLKKECFLDVNQSDYDTLKPLLLSYYQSYLEKGNYDLFYGFLGLSKVLEDFYSTEEFLELNKKFFLKTVEQEDFFSKWASLFIDRPGVYNFGLAHGMPSIVLYLVKLYELDPDAGTVFKDLAISSCHYIISKKQDYNLVGSYFPNNYNDHNQENQASRLAWCYGDLGVGYCLWKVGTAFNDQKIVSIGLEVLLSCTERKSPESTKVVDLSVCHGSSGLILFFKRLYEFTGLIEFKQATEYWLSYTLTEINTSKDISEIKSWKGNEQRYAFEVGMLTGVAGIGLVLLEILEEKKYSWSDWLLL